MRSYAVSDVAQRADDIVRLAIREPDGLFRRMERDLAGTGAPAWAPAPDATAVAMGLPSAAPVANLDLGEETFAFMSIRQNPRAYAIVTDIRMLALCSHRGAGLL